MSGPLPRQPNSESWLETVFEQLIYKCRSFAAFVFVDTELTLLINSHPDTALAGWHVQHAAGGDGVSDAGEVKTLAELGITSVNLTSNGQTNASQAGMLVHGTTTTTTATTG